MYLNMNYLQKLSGIILTLFLSLFILSCNKTNSDQVPETNLDKITVPEGFNYNTTEDISVFLKINGDGSAKYNRAKFFVYSGDPDISGVLLSSGGVDNNGVYETIVSIPVILDSLYISSNITGISLGMIEVNNNIVSHEFSVEPASFMASNSRRISVFTDIISDFEDGLDGWKPYRDVSMYYSDAPNTPIVNGPMGVSDNFIWGFDTRGGLRSWEAPAKFSGNLYGQYIAYHYYLGNTVQARPVQNNIADIRITDGNNVLAIDLSATFQHEVNAGWQTIYCKLDETETSGSGWKIGNMSIWTTSSGSASTPSQNATAAQIQDILQNVTGILLGPEYQVGYYSSNGPEFIALGKVGVVSDVNTFPIIQQGEEPDDNDGDGVPNSTDDYPEDPDKAYNNYGPGEAIYGTLAYEDLWPQKGDYDFNDVVIDYNYNVVTNASNKVVEVNSNFMLKATGAGYLNGFAYELPIDQSKIVSVTGQELSDNVFTINDNGTESGQNNAVIIVFDDAHTLFNEEGFVNTIPDLTYFEPVSINVVVAVDGSIDISDLGTSPYNPFIIANQQRGYEIHLSGQTNTSLANESLFGTDQDDSDINSSKYYQTVNNLPWAIHLPVGFDYPEETVSIEQAHLKFVEWAESGGSSYPDWYLNESGYRNSNLVYIHN
jgi:LruC domain-containing protein